MATTNRWWRLVRLLFGFALLLSVAGFVGAQWQQRLDSEERSVLVARFPIVKEQERAACTREFTAKVEGLERVNKQVAQALADNRAQMDDMHELAAYTLRFLGDRAKLNDARQADVIKQARAAAAAANTAAKKSEVVVQKTEVVEQKVNVATVNAAEAASTAKAVNKRLDTAVQPPQTAKPWIGNQR